MASGEEAESENEADHWERMAYAARSESRHEDALVLFSMMASAADASAIQVAHALKCRGLLLSDLKRFGEALEAYESLIERFVTASDPVLMEKVVMAMIEKGETLCDLHRPDEAFMVYGQVIERFERFANQALRREVRRVRNIIYMRRNRKAAP